MEISFIYTQSLFHLHVNKTNFHVKGFALGLALKQRRKAIRKSPISKRVWLAFSWSSTVFGWIGLWDDRIFIEVDQRCWRSPVLTTTVSLSRQHLLTQAALLLLFNLQGARLPRFLGQPQGFASQSEFDYLFGLKLRPRDLRSVSIEDCR